MKEQSPVLALYFCSDPAPHCATSRRRARSYDGELAYVYLVQVPTWWVVNIWAEDFVADTGDVVYYGVTLT